MADNKTKFMKTEQLAQWYEMTARWEQARTNALTGNPVAEEMLV